MKVKANVGTIVSVLPTLLISAASFGQVQDRVSATEKGSLLIINKVELKWTAAGVLTQDTFIQLTNDNNAGVNVHMFFVNGDEPTPAIPAGQPGGPERAHPGWNWINNEIYLTQNQPTYWSALTGQPAQGGLSSFTVLDPGFPPGRPDPDPGATGRVLRGFIIAFAVNAEDHQISWNHLAANVTIVNYALGTAWEYNAWGFQCVAAVATGATCGPAGQILMDGVWYSRSFAELLMNFQAVGASAFSGPANQVISTTDLTLHIVTTDLRQNGNGPRRTKAKFDVWNQNELKFSGAERCITCWYQALLDTWAPLANHFTRPNLQTNVGKARINGEASEVVCGLGPPASTAESLLGVIMTLLVFDGTRFAEAGTNLHGLGFENATIWYDQQTGEPPPGTAGDFSSPQQVIDTMIRSTNEAINNRK
jgi:hypothetical protein